MPLPNFDEVKDLLVRLKQDDQSWGNLFREISSGTLQNEISSLPVARIITAKLSLIQVLAEWDFYSSQFLDQAASDYEVKSWQVTEYVEALREALTIGESDLVIYEKKDSTIPRQAEPSFTPDSAVSDSAQNEPRYVQDQNSDPRSARLEYEVPMASSSNTAATKGPSNTVLALTGLVSALVVILVVLIASISNQRSGSLSSPPSGQGSSDRSSSESGPGNSQGSPPKTTNAEVYFTGIDLPVTNTLCNKKRSFCIYNLATLVKNESGEATYSFSDIANGQQVSINGTITISNIDRSGGSRTFTFSFRDDQNNTTPGWAAAGYFNLDQDSNPAKPGILTRFKTTESFGPKTPVGLENTSYLFPS
jgi:hypothetical protein